MHINIVNFSQLKPSIDYFKAFLYIKGPGVASNKVSMKIFFLNSVTFKVFFQAPGVKPDDICKLVYVPLPKRNFANHFFYKVGTFASNNNV